MSRKKPIPSDAIEIMVLNPDPDVHHYRKGVHENLWIKERFGKDNYVSIGVFLKEGTSELQYYFFKYCDKSPQIFSSLSELKKYLPSGKKHIFDKTPKLYIMGHGDDESKYGIGNYHGDGREPPNDTEQIYDDKFEKLIVDILGAISTQHNEVEITLEACNTDNLATAEKTGKTKSFLERLSAEYPQVTFCGTGPWSDSKDPESLETGYRASGGYPSLNAPITSMGGSIWKHGNTVIFHHKAHQIAVRKSPFASTETAKKLKINTVDYAREILNQQAELRSDEREAIITKICANRKILKIEDLKHEPDFPHQAESASEEVIKLMENETIILKQEQDRYLQRVHAILLQDNYSDRDVLMISLGLSHTFIFNGHDDVLQKVLANEHLLKLVMVSCGKVLIGAQDNNSVIDLLVKRGISINSVDEKGMTALHYASNNFYVYRAEPLNLVKKLLDCGANAEVHDKDGRTPLMLAAEQSRKETVIAGGKLLKLLEQKLFEQSLLNPAITSGRNANCFFQSFMHIFTRLPNKIYLQLLQDSQCRLSLQHLVGNFNQVYLKLLPRPFNLKEIIEFSRLLHPLDRELIFGPVLRATYNTLVEAKLIQTEFLGFGEHDIVLAHQTVAFANCFGACLSAYMSEEEFNKAGMPPEVADRVLKCKVVVDDAIFVCDRQADQPSLWEMNLVFSGIHLNYTHGTPELNQREREQVIMSQSVYGACFASAPVDFSSAPLFSANTDDIFAFRMVKLFYQVNASKSLIELLSVNTEFFRRVEDGFLEEHRHDDPGIQQKYDERFGLILKQ